MYLFDETEKAILAALISHHVRFVVIGGYAVIFHGVDRIRNDLDVVIDNARANAVQVREAVRSLGCPVPSLEDLTKPRMQLSCPRLEFEILTSVCVPFDELLQESMPAPAPVPSRVVSLRHLILLKRDACAHEKHPDRLAMHRADLAALEALDASTQ